MKKFVSLLATATIAMPLFAGSVAFDSSWKVQNFPLKASAQFSPSGNSLGISNDAGVSAIYTKVGSGDWASSWANWSWSVSQSVAATDLRAKGGDDRNIAVYFVFAPNDQAEKLSNSGISKLLSSKSTKALVYTHGGKDGRGSVFGNPYMKGRGQTFVLRGSGEGNWSENVNLASDYSKAFGGDRGALIGIVITSDSDDTKGVVSAKISGLKLGQ